MASTYREAAKRSNQRAREQAQTVLDRLDQRLKEKDWKGHVNRVRAAFKERGGAAKLADLREDIRLRLLNDDAGISANLAELSMTALDGAIKAASKGDLDEVAAHLRGVMDFALRAFESPEMGRQPVGIGMPNTRRGKTKRPPIGGGVVDAGWCAALAACLIWAYSSLVVSLILCGAIPFCWCCIHLLILGTFAVHETLCHVLFQKRCTG
jgi:hypothetical protein